MIAAFVSVRGDWAIASIGESLFVLDHNADSTPRAVDDEEATRLLREARRLAPVTVHDLESLRRHLAVRAERDELLHATLLMLDAERGPEVKRLAREEVIAHAASDQWPWVTGLLAAAPLPSTAVDRVKLPGGHPMADALARLRAHQPQIDLARKAFEALPATLFASESRDIVRARLVDQGVFAALSGLRSAAEDNPFKDTIERFARVLADTARGAAEPEVVLLGPPDLNAAWRVRPWRSVWLGTRWPQVMPACAAAAARPWSELVVMLADQGLQAGRPGVHSLQPACDQWLRLRHGSAYTTILNSIGSLRSNASDRVSALVDAARRNQWTEDTPSAQIIARLVSLAEGASESSLLRAWQVFVDAPELDPLGAARDAANRARDLGQSWLLESAIDDGLHRLEWGGGFGREVDWKAGSAQHADDLVQRFRSLVGVHALDRVFRAGGFLVAGTPAAGAATPGGWPKFLVLVNLDRCQGVDLHGHEAGLVGLLAQRLAGDIGSGVPIERCGWLAGRHLSQTLGLRGSALDALLARVLKRMQEQASSGAPNYFEASGDAVRLSPELACSPTVQPTKTDARTPFATGTAGS